MPSGGRSVLSPAQFHAVGGGTDNGEIGRDRAGRDGREVHGVAPYAFAETVADTLHSHFVFGFRIETFECGGRGIGLYRLPLAGRDGSSDVHMVDMQVVVTVPIDCGFAIESNLHWARVTAQVDAHMLACGGDVIENIV